MSVGGGVNRRRSGGRGGASVIFRVVLLFRTAGGKKNANSLHRKTMKRRDYYYYCFIFLAYFPTASVLFLPHDFGVGKLSKKITIVVFDFSKSYRKRLLTF